MSTVTDIKTDSMPSPPEDPYRYGFRDDQVLQADGTYKCVRVPLTLEDHLHPHEGDHFMEDSYHDSLRGFLRDVFRMKLRGDPTAIVLSNAGVYWDDLALGHHAPDVAVIFGVRHRLRKGESFYVRSQGTRPKLIVEVVSPAFRKNDVVIKFDEYYRAGVQLYVILDQLRDEDPWSIKAYRRTPQGYVQLPLDKDGRLWLEDLNLWLAVDGFDVHCFDGETGEELKDYGDVTAEKQQMRELAEAERTRANAEKARAEQEKARANAVEQQLRDAQKIIEKLKKQLPPS